MKCRIAEVDHQPYPQRGHLANNLNLSFGTLLQKINNEPEAVYHYVCRDSRESRRAFIAKRECSKFSRRLDNALYMQTLLFCLARHSYIEQPMKIIFSRKGVDSSFGGVASPILPDGTLLSLPIPRSSSISYNQLNINGQSLGPIVKDLTKGKIMGEDSLHLDPDLRASMYPRRPGWRPLFGQRGAHQRHLHHHGV